MKSEEFSERKTIEAMAVEKAMRAVRDTEADRLLTVKEVAEFIQLSPGRTYILMESGYIPSIKLGKKRNAPIRVSWRALLAWTEERSRVEMPDFPWLDRKKGRGK